MRVILSTASLYLLAALVVRSVSFLTVPITSRLLLPTDFGAIALASLIGSLVTTAVGFGGDLTFTRFYFRGSSQVHRNLVVTSWSAFTVIGHTTTVLLSVGGIAILMPFLEQEAKACAELTIIALWTVPFSAVSVLSGQILRNKGQHRAFAGATIISGLLPVPFLLLAIGPLGLGARGFMLAQLLSVAIFAPVSLLWAGVGLGSLKISYIRLRRLTRVTTHIVGRMLKYGASIGAAGFLGWAVLAGDRLILSHYASLADVGQFALALSLAQLLTFFTAALVQAWLPQFQAVLGKDQNAAARFLVDTSGDFLFAAGILAVLLANLAPLIINLLAGPNFSGSWVAVPLLCFAYWANTSTIITNAGLTVKLESNWILAGSAICLVIDIVLGALLCKSLGIIGVALANMLGNIGMTVFYYRKSQSVWPVQFPIVRLLALSLGTLAACVAPLLASELGVNVTMVSVAAVSVYTLSYLLSRLNSVCMMVLRAVRE